jgi:DNA-binding NtrC family response regulator
MIKKWLISWIGTADHEAAEGKRGDDLGPVAMALLGETRYQRVHLLTNYPHARSKDYCDWLERQVPYAGNEIFLTQLDVQRVIDHAEIYSAVCAEFKTAGLPRDDVELTFHLSPGTPAMAAIWIILAKTRFPAKLIQTSKQSGLEPVDFPFDLAGDFLPEYLARTSDQIKRLADWKTPPEFKALIGNSLVLQVQIERAQRFAAFDVPVLILGETGTGKELFAEAIHRASLRVDKKLVPFNCGAITSEMANSELFGHKKGAFTGATADRKGLFLEADGGTLFLDEVGDLSLDSQVRLLRVLQEQKVTPLGTSIEVPVNVRVVAATHRDLAAEVCSGRFREDLYHRLALGILRLPSLRDRGDDLQILIDYFLNQCNSEFARSAGKSKSLSMDAVHCLLLHPWPGNIRELRHTILRAWILADGEEIGLETVSDALLPIGVDGDDSKRRQLGQGIDLKKYLDDVATDLIKQAWAKSGRRIGGAATLLGFPKYQTLTNWMKRLGINSETGGK